MPLPRARKEPLEDDPSKGVALILIMFVVGLVLGCYGVLTLLGYAP